MNVQNEVMKIHFKYGTSELANYKIQILFDQLFDDYKSNLQSKIDSIDTLSQESKAELKDIINGN